MRSELLFYLRCVSILHLAATILLNESFRMIGVGLPLSCAVCNHLNAICAIYIVHRFLNGMVTAVCDEQNKQLEMPCEIHIREYQSITTVCYQLTLMTVGSILIGWIWGLSCAVTSVGVVQGWLLFWKEYKATEYYHDQISTETCQWLDRCRSFRELKLLHKWHHHLNPVTYTYADPLLDVVLLR